MIQKLNFSAFYAIVACFLATALVSCNKEDDSPIDLNPHCTLTPLLLAVGD